MKGFGKAAPWLAPWLVMAAAKPVLAQGVPLSELQGASIEASVLRSQVVRNGGKEYLSRVQNGVDFRVGRATL